MRRRLAVLAAVPLLALMLGGGTASAAPAHQAAPAHPAITLHPLRPGYVVQTSDVRDWCWGVDQSYQPQWVGSPQTAANEGPLNCTVAGQIEFVVYPCAPPPNQGYCSLTEVAYNVFFGYFSTTGYCVGYSYDLNRLVQQVCGNYSYQAWAGVVQPDGSHLIWNWWLDSYHHNVCPVPGGYTQQVITADSTTGPLYLSCPQGQGESYLAKQSWYVGNPIM